MTRGRPDARPWEHRPGASSRRAQARRNDTVAPTWAGACGNGLPFGHAIPAGHRMRVTPHPSFHAATPRNREIQIQ
ncbi:hypothetical protein [Komagataeibacter europaeus]|uniref:hypothetical protein n=1 Tax=Komagataeibacter europaeus TaxID=33995 RepID=UPI0006A6DBB0|nr:hypothetical protein [Komagataeibacter europaeus]